MNLGQKARDKITGFEGTIIGRAEYLTGCTQFCLAPKTTPDGSCYVGAGHTADREPA